MGGFYRISGKSEGERGYRFFLKKWKIRGGGGGILSELLSMVGVWIFSETTQVFVHVQYLCMYLCMESVGQSQILTTTVLC